MKKEMAEKPLVQELRLIEGVKVKVAEPLARYTTIKIGGPADYFLDLESSAGLALTMRALDRHGIPFRLLGRGSNVLVSDLGVRGAVIRLGGGVQGDRVGRRTWAGMGERRSRLSCDPAGAGSGTQGKLRAGVCRGDTGKCGGGTGYECGCLRVRDGKGCGSS